MKKITIIFIALAFFAISCNQPTRNQAETASNETICEQVAETEKYIHVYCSENENTYFGDKCSLNERYSTINGNVIQLREISRNEFTTRRRESHSLQHRPNHKRITESAELQQLLGDRVRGVGEFRYWYDSLEITCNNSTTKVHNMPWGGWNDLIYYPELGLLIVPDPFRDTFGVVIDLNNSEREWRELGFPEFHNLSPDKQWRLNGRHGKFGFNYYFLEKWNSRRRRFEFFGNFDSLNPPDFDGTFWALECFWVGNSTLLLSSAQGFFEIEIIDGIPIPPPTSAGGSWSFHEYDVIFETADKMPQFPGGVSEMMNFIEQNIRFPSVYDAITIQGNVILQFVVRKDGTITDIEVVRTVSPNFAAEAIRIVETMPRWIPGERNGEKVNVRFTLPVRFQVRSQ